MRKIPLIRTGFVLAVGAMFLAPITVSAWHATGHMIVAQIAYDGVSDEARREIDRLIALLAEHSPRRDHAVTASLWADDLKLQGVEVFDHWHYINRPFSAGFSGEVPPPQAENVVWAIEQSISTLRGEAGDLAKALMLRFLLHFVGDIHQPLHCASRYSAKYPEGDRGGNDFPLAGQYEQLHAYWDHGAALFPVLDGKDWPTQGRRLTDETTRAVPKSTLAQQWRESDPEAWAAESFKLAVEVAYAGVADGAEPTAEYDARARRVIRRRLALAGYRLAALLNDLFAEEAAVEP